MPKGKRHSAQFKFKVALEAAKSTKTLAEIASQYGVHPSQTLALRASASVSKWKQQLLMHGPTVFSTQTAREQREQEALQVELYEQIGRLKMELEWLKKSYRMTFRPSVRWSKQIIQS